MWLAAITASIPLHAQESAVAIGKKLAVDSGVRWTVRDLRHPLLGSIKFAVQERDVATVVGNEKILSLTYVSCQKTSEKIAIELTNAPSSAPATGLGPVDLPRLVCNSPRPQGGLVKSDLAASWEIGVLGDALARGLSPAELRRCVSIDVLQNVALPRGWPRESQPLTLQITPYARELDEVFAMCFEPSAYAQDEPRPAAVAPPARLSRTPEPTAPPARTPAPPAERKAQPEDASWKAARTVANGRTNVRAGANLGSAVVIQLDPGALILVQPTSTDWWKVKPRSGAAYGGYIREDRLQLERPAGR